MTSRVVMLAAMTVNFDGADQSMGYMAHPFREAQQKRARELVVLSALDRRALCEYEGAQRRRIHVCSKGVTGWPSPI
jgi:hypothetical protein